MGTAGLVRTDAVVVGGGLAGLWAALHLPSDWEVMVVDKGRGPDLGSSPWAQGGMAVAASAEDSPDLHAEDTMRAGAGLCDEAAVRVLVEEAPTALLELVRLGCRFDRVPDGSFHLNREGGQTVARSVHAADATGREIMRVVVAEARRRARRLVGTATRLLVAQGRCAGVRVATDHGDVDVLGRATLLASGGCGALFSHTTNPETATGDGAALAYEGGAEVADCEFVQFHPTALAAGGLRRVLLTEALRGAGAVVVDGGGRRFLLDVHPDGELAPRDLVARAIAGAREAFLDARPVGAETIAQRFPNVAAAVREAGYDLALEPVPVAPAAHYFLGGVRTDVWGRTSLEGLFAAGECAATGVHGANRLAGNSLTEALVFGRRAALAMAQSTGFLFPPREDDFAPREDDEDADGGVRLVPPDAWTCLRGAMWRGAGLVRDRQSIHDALATAEEISRHAPISLRLAAVAATLVCRSALAREESRGVHFRSDHPVPDDAWRKRHVILRREDGT